LSAAVASMMRRVCCAEAHASSSAASSNEKCVLRVAPSVDRHSLAREGAGGARVVSEA
jgi:hypothetical protein